MSAQLVPILLDRCDLCDRIATTAVIVDGEQIGIYCFTHGHRVAACEGLTVPEGDPHKLVIDAYLDACRRSEPPMEAVADVLGVSYGTACRRVRDARMAGWALPASAGLRRHAGTQPERRSS